MKLTFLGGADEVGASSALLEVAGKRILIDAGIRISPRTSRGIDNSQLPDLQPISAGGGPDYIFVTHAHTDHTGALPLITELYPHVPVIMTRPTLALTRVLQQDAQRIMKNRQEEEGELPLFDEIAVETLMNAAQIAEFRQPIRLSEHLQATYYVSGHIAGAGLIVFESTEGTLIMSGDVSKSPQRTVTSVDIPNLKADALVLESTYGGRLHAERRAEELRLIEMLQRVVERGGKVLIPAFALGRAQEIIQIILAYRDQLSVPVYVDGMVRTVCRAYQQFTDLLPEATVRAAGEDSLFFRRNIRPITSMQERQQIADSAEPLVVVASSGMLTGGASSFYAGRWAGDEANAILLTGYQDEEAPGRFLQRMMRERQAGQSPTLRLGNQSVSVACQIDTYSLSAHADETELVNMSLALKPEEVLLVHGDHGARHSLATALRRRQMAVNTPRIGTIREFAFVPRPWAIGVRLQTGTHHERADLEALWQSMQEFGGNTFSVAELARAWWGDDNRADELRASLERPDNIFFAADWRSKRHYQVRTAEQVARLRRQQAIMLAHPNIVGQLVVLRNSNGQPRLGLVTAADAFGFQAEVAGTRGNNYPGDALLWAIGPWQPVAGVEGGLKAQLSALSQQASAIAPQFLPLEMRQHLVAQEHAIPPDSLLPTPLPDDMTYQLALTSIVLGLAEQGAILEEGGLRPLRTLETGGIMDQHAARAYALERFPVEARLRKVGLEVHKQRLVLNFDFPQVAESRYVDLLNQIMDVTGWEVQVKPSVNQQALSEVLYEILPAGAHIVRGPSFYLDKREVHFEIDSLDDPQALERAYREITGHQLVLTEARTASAPVAMTAPPTGQRMEINAAYAHIRAHLGDQGLYKTSLKGDQIVLTFISPQVGQRHAAVIARLAQEVGYPLSIHEHPNQQMILQVMRQLASSAGWLIRKGPGIHIDRASLSISLAQPAAPAQIEQVRAELLEQTGYNLEIG